MDLRSLLRKKIAKNVQEEKEVLKAEIEHYTKLMNKPSTLTKSIPESVPKFYWRLPKENEHAKQKLHEDARSNFLQRRSRQLVDNNELRFLWVQLTQYQNSPEDQLITYSDYLNVALNVGPKIKPYFTTTVFAKLYQGDPQGRISIMSVFNYVMRKVWSEQTRVGLSLYDNTGRGFLRELDLEHYISEFLSTVPELDGLESSFHSFYLCTAVRKFLFFLDPLRTGRVRILDILACSFLDDLLELRDEELSKEAQEQNWFSAPSALRLYSNYLNLDRDHNGMLSLSELAAYGSGTLTRPFLERVFQTCVTYGGEMDYKTYLDLVLALENRSEPPALTFLFRILDINYQGYLDAFTLNYFFRAIQDQMKAHGAELVSFEDVKDELFDMVRPENPEKITLNDLLACGQGDTFVSILIEFHGFWAYENREAVTAESGQ